MVGGDNGSSRNETWEEEGCKENWPALWWGVGMGDVDGWCVASRLAEAKAWCIISRKLVQVWRMHGKILVAMSWFWTKLVLAVVSTIQLSDVLSTTMTLHGLSFFLMCPTTYYKIILNRSAGEKKTQPASCPPGKLCLGFSIDLVAWILYHNPLNTHIGATIAYYNCLKKVRRSTIRINHTMVGKLPWNGKQYST